MNAPADRNEQSALGTKRWIGESVPRPNGRRLVEGKARYVDDLRLPHLIVAKIIEVHLVDGPARGVNF